ncbi:hypothetical protein EPA93_40570 [Ktedonosporobacter rubrisoli]|uniref:Class I SAM-dependent methyltransferase n=1 Tax=Ktedonosporobacter rubrisoli TaxID=2509675 RepID=A0A4P6K1J3_KTERU|nr:hypothetical protein [Ktedonosporobacter rubrisoli]QBD81939.1 hypothetical protein EPA93_40570 [Ktedonosporobacter rubrisoli]
MQGKKRREWLRQYAPLHLEHCAALMLSAVRWRPFSTSRSTLVLGAGACTEVPLPELVQASDEVVLADLDIIALQQGVADQLTPGQRKRVKLVAEDLSGGVSANLHHRIILQPWDTLLAQGASTLFKAAAECLEQCLVPDPPSIEQLPTGEFGVVVSSLVLSQLFSYPILDLLDHIQRLAPALMGEQERHYRYQEAAQAFRTRLIKAHLHLLSSLLDQGGLVVLLSDVQGFVFNVYGTEHDEQHRRKMPLVPRIFPELVREHFTVLEERRWEWITDLPTKDRPGRGYEVSGYILAPPAVS